MKAQIWLLDLAQWHPTPVLLPGKSHGRRSLVGCSPWGREESGTTERPHFHFSLSCIGEGNGNPLQCSCLENPRDSGAWWAAVYGVAQSWTRLKRPSSSSSKRLWNWKRNLRTAFTINQSERSSVVSDSVTPWTIQSMEFSSPEYRSGQPFPSPGIFPTQESNQDLLHCRRILYQLSYQGSPCLQ